MFFCKAAYPIGRKWFTRCQNSRNRVRNKDLRNVPWWFMGGSRVVHEWFTKWFTKCQQCCNPLQHQELSKITWWGSQVVHKVGRLQRPPKAAEGVTLQLLPRVPGSLQLLHRSEEHTSELQSLRHLV